ncbi:hypothetical protein BKA82DRAFT_166976 [Pisolithus tinctorius]|uniref:Retrovirus-related Pol polyprotein from transposon TNT 1-94-like beta-barrel domain-containing protein n=1 Tax=Pisolithus tinctorius Marx 270 TaxID=870435 RepID=A0A0C3JBG0_PISTI|nr:hypothetical protein BKA82DRAFT_166976 [Pisolithus tinctorius]KIN95016.1 hypothetical protein M404DRAFT_166976 [Pisolithus tinctorius Marx 270]
MAHHQKWFTSFRELNPGRPVTLGDSSTIEATGIGTVTLQTKVSGTTNDFILSDVLYVPDFKVTLISVNKLAKSGLSTYFPGDSNTCSVDQGR